MIKLIILIEHFDGNSSYSISKKKNLDLLSPLAYYGEKIIYY